MKVKMSDYPEHDKLIEVQEASQRLGDFMDWLRAQGYSISEFHEHGMEPSWYPIHRTIDEWLASFYGIDLNKIETEKRAMLETIRRLQAGE